MGGWTLLLVGLFGLTSAIGGKYWTEFAYLPTDRDLGVLLEIFIGMPGAE